MRIRNRGLTPIRFFLREKGKGFYFAILEMTDYAHWGDGWTFFGISHDEEGFKFYFCERG